MKKFLVLVAILLLALSAGAKEAKHARVYVGAGLGVPTGDAGDGWNTGFHGQVGLGFSAGPRLEIIPRLGYHSFSLDDQGLGISGGGLSVFMVGADAKLAFADAPKRTIPYAFGGLGLANASFGDMTIPGFGTVPGDSETKLYINVGGGLDFNNSSKTPFFAEARLVSVSTSGSSITYIPLTFGMRF